MTAAPQSQELEIKLWLSAEQYDQLLQTLPDKVSEAVQRNLFLDTDDGQLSTGRWALRLRLEQRAGAPPQMIVALKGPARQLGNAVHRTEIEATADPSLWQRALANGLSADAIPGAPGDYLRQELALNTALNPVLQFENHRSTIRLSLDGESHLVELDRTLFSTGEIDHELELELTGVEALTEAQAALEVHVTSAALQGWLAGHGIAAKPSAGGKYSRARRYAGRL